MCYIYILHICCFQWVACFTKLGARRMQMIVLVRVILRFKRVTTATLFGRGSLWCKCINLHFPLLQHRPSKFLSFVLGGSPPVIPQDVQQTVKLRQAKKVRSSGRQKSDVSSAFLKPVKKVCKNSANFLFLSVFRLVDHPSKNKPYPTLQAYPNHIQPSKKLVIQPYPTLQTNSKFRVWNVPLERHCLRLPARRWASR